ncbi:hypothetical protein C1A50_3128 [Paenibacillus polymyxa]|nr:hypothetical protein C1A50_3128 [Paenibacillus polymyxa]
MFVKKYRLFIGLDEPINKRYLLVLQFKSLFVKDSCFGDD